MINAVDQLYFSCHDSTKQRERRAACLVPQKCQTTDAGAVVLQLLEYRPTRRCPRQHGVRLYQNLTTLLVAILFSISWSIQGAEAASLSRHRSALIRHTGSGILFDRGAPPVPRMRVIKRAEQETSSSTVSATYTTTSASSTFSSTQRTTTDSASPLPSPFDTTLGNNFTTTTCPAFFTSFLSNSTFNDCVPLSLLLQVRYLPRLVTSIG